MSDDPADRDFLDEMIAEEVAADPHFLELLAAAEERRARQRRWLAIPGSDPSSSDVLWRCHELGGAGSSVDMDPRVVFIGGGRAFIVLGEDHPEVLLALPGQEEGIERALAILEAWLADVAGG